MKKPKTFKEMVEYPKDMKYFSGGLILFAAIILLIVWMTQEPESINEILDALLIISIVVSIIFIAGAPFYCILFHSIFETEDHLHEIRVEWKEWGWIERLIRVEILIVKALPIAVLTITTMTVIIKLSF